MATPEELANAAKLAEKGQEAITKAKEDYAEALAEANKVVKDSNNLLKEEVRLEKALIEEKEKAIAVGEDQQKLNKKLISQMNQMNGANKNRREKLNNEIASTKAQIELEKLKLEKIARNSQEMKGNLKIVKKATKFQKEYGEAVEENLENAKKATETYSAIFKEFAGELPVVGTQLSKLFKQQANMAKMGDRIIAKSKSMNGVTAKMTKGLGNYLKKVGMATVAAVTLVGILAKLALKFDDLSKSIGRATGFGNEFANTLTEGYKQTMSSGVGIKEYADSVTSLANSFSGFNPSAEKTNIHLANTASQLTKLGVSADSSAKLMDHFHRAMGVGQKAAADMTAQLVLMGKNAGITAAKMANDFQASAGRLAIYGKNNIKVFKQLAAQAKATGLEMSTLLSVSEKFDKFDSAAESVSKLNAVLGTQLSTLEMMNATDAERVKMMKEQIQASVGNFDSQDKFTKMYIAQAMGVKDVAEAQRLLNMSQAQASKYAQEQKESADIQAELAERTKELVPLMEKLKIAGYKLIMAFSPVIQVFTWLIEKLAIGIDMIAEFAAIVGPTVLLVVSIGKAVLAFGAAAGTVATPIGWVVLGVLALVAVLGQLWEIIHKPGSLSMAGGLFDKTIGKSLSALGSDAQAAGSDLDGLSGKMDGLYDTTHKGPGGGFDIQAMASLDTTAIAAGFNKIKSAVMELSNIKLDGFLAMHTDGSSSSFVMGSDGLIKSISEGKLIVDVKMPEMKLPEVLVKVFIGDRELKSIIRTEVKALGGAMG